MHPQKISELFQLLSLLIPHLVPPMAYLPLVLYYPDSHSATIDNTKIVGLIDRSGAQNLPLMLTAKFPDDLNSTEDDTYERPVIPDEDWNAVPHESPNEIQPLPHGWTSFGDTSK